MLTLVPPEVFDTLIQLEFIGCTCLMSAYFDNHLEPNLNLMCDFPLIPWCREIVVLFVGKRKLCITCGPPESVIHHCTVSFFCCLDYRLISFFVQIHCPQKCFKCFGLFDCSTCISLTRVFLGMYIDLLESH